MSGLMICGTASDSGKSTIVAGLCRLLAREGLRVAPFKAQNMALNSAVTAEGHEIGRAQAAQARAAGVEPEVAMNPILLKPTDHRTSQVMVGGRPWAVLDAAAYQQAKADLWPLVTESLDDLRGRYDVVICEGAGSPAEINLLAHDIVNLRVAAHAGFPAVVVGDIDRGGVFAALFGTVALLPGDLAGLIRGFVINKFRGDPSLLGPGIDELGERTGIPVLGVLPWIDGLDIDAEDSLALARRWPAQGPEPATDGHRVLDVAVIRLPRISNFTDLEALALEPRVRVRMIEHPGDLGRADLLVLPGSKATVADLTWLRRRGWAEVISAQGGPRSNPGPGPTVLGICGGYQMLGRQIVDPVEAGAHEPVPGLALLPATTRFEAEKVTRRVAGKALGRPIHGYEIHHGRTEAEGAWIQTEHGPEGSVVASGRVVGTSIHGLFESDPFRRAFLAAVAARAGVDWDPGPEVSFAAARDAQFDRVADALAFHLDIDHIHALIKAAAR